MIPSSSSRKLPREARRTLQSAFEQLHLPWLAPRVYTRAQSPVRPRLQHRATTTIANRSSLGPARSQSSPIIPRHNGQQQERNYAYAASPDDRGSRADDFYIPLVSEHGRSSGPEISSDSIRDPFVTSPLLLDDSTLLPQTSFALDTTSKTTLQGPEELLQHLDACLIVGLHDRAAATMRRLNKLYELDDPDLVRAHNFYIGYMIGQYNKEGDDNLLHKIQRWYHVDMVDQGVKPDAATLAMMVQLMLYVDDAHRAARGVRKYMGAAQDLGLQDDVVAELSCVVNSDDFSRITEMVPGLAATGNEQHSIPSERIENRQLSDADAAEKDGKMKADWTDGLPKVLDVVQRGEGLRAIKRSIASLSSQSNPQETQDLSEDEIRLFRQTQLENDAEVAAVERWKADSLVNADRPAVFAGVLRSGVFNTRMWNWHSDTLKLLREEIQEYSTMSENPDISIHQHAYAPYIRFISPERLSALTIVGVLNSFAIRRKEGAYITVATAAMAIATIVEQESTVEWARIRKRNRFALNAKLKGENTDIKTTETESTSLDGTTIKKTKLQRQIISTSMEAPDWSQATKARLGSALLSIFLRVLATAPLESSGGAVSTPEKAQPAIVKRVIFIKGRKVGVLVPEPGLFRELRSCPAAATITKRLPMLMQPVPWSGFKKGGYLKGSVPAVRLPHDTFQNKAYAKLAIDNGDMKQVLKGLDVLGKTSWRINQNVYRVFLTAWNTGEAIANVPALDPILPYPDVPSHDATLAEKIAYQRDRRRVANELAGLHSQRCYMNFQLQVATAFLKEDFYMPHNMDFRGRAYPIPPHLNHMGPDHCRGLLLFARGKELGTRGLEWLKIHLANVYGYDKASLSERKAFAEESLEQIRDSADHPLDGQQWWLKAEDPWQCLAACFELRDALSLADPSKFISHLPIHQDGTCNGLQHYAALGGDEAGAKQVNLEPGDRPSDIYTAVSDLVKGYIGADAATGLEVAKILDGKITRKIVKQTVMTNVYGVTFQGARLQVSDRLEELYPELFKGDRVLNWTASTYIARKIFDALGKIFNGASAIQKWLGDSAGRICDSMTPEQMDLVEELKSKAETLPHQAARKKAKRDADEMMEHMQFRSSVIWTTPLGMPVVQPYRGHASQQVTTNLQKLTIAEPTVGDKVLKRKQLQAFPPNFIHSLDATHMFLSALKCDELGMTFAAVHDSFWTHASDIDDMSGVLRDAFVRMHSEDIVGRLDVEFRARYKDNLHLLAVDPKSPVGERIKELRRNKGFRKKGENQHKVTEMLEERQRQRLLASSDPELRRQGDAMVTPASIYAEMQNDPTALVAEDALEEVARLDDESAESGEELNIIDADNEATVDDPVSEDITDPELNLAGMWKTSQKRQYALIGASKESQDTMKQMQKHLGSAVQKPRRRPLWLWTPLTFPSLPEKGSWNVSRLKESKYFFS